MPFVSTGSTGFGDALRGFADIIGAAAPIVGAFTGQPARLQPISVQPGGAVVPVSQAAFDLPGLQVPGTGQTLRSPFVATTEVLVGSPFRPTMAGAAAKIFMIGNPVSGKATWFGPLGRPLLWSRDLSTCKRVKRIARRARRAGG